MGRRLLSLVAVVVLGSGLGVGTAGARSHSARSGSTSAVSASDSAGWRQLSTGTPSSLSSIGLARFGKQVEAVWEQPSSGSSQDLLFTASVGAHASSTGGAVQVLPAWGAVNRYPAILQYGAYRLIAFSGIRSTSPDDPYEQGYEYGALSTDGKSWVLGDGSLTASNTAYGSYGTDSVSANGVPLTVYTAGSTQSVSYIHGIFDSIPETPTADSSTSSTGNFAYNSGVGFDPVNSTGWAVWASNSGDAATEGVSAQQVLPSLGPLVHAPKTVTTYSGASYSNAAESQRIQVAARSRGGLYAAYPVGYPEATKVALWHVGTSKVFLRHGGPSVHVVDAAPGTGGRIWLLWWTSGSKYLQVARTNPAATRLGATCRVRLPGGSQNSVWDVEGYGDGQGVDAFINDGSVSSSTIDVRYLEDCLTVTARPKSLARSSGGAVTVSVTDAGAPVHGAKVRFAGATEHTNHHGKAKFHVGSGTRAGRQKVVVSKAGYATTVTKVSVH